jgi:hypothetical protein
MKAIGLLLHLLHYTARPVIGLTLRTRVPAGEVHVISPDFAGERRVPVRDGKCRLPELRTYSVVAIGEKR